MLVAVGFSRSLAMAPRTKAAAKAKAVVLRRPAASDTFKLKFTFPTGKTITQDGFKASNTITEVLAAILCPRSLLEHNNEILAARMTLNSYNIGPDSTLLVLAVSPSTPRAWLGEGLARSSWSYCDASDASE